VIWVLFALLNPKYALSQQLVNPFSQYANPSQDTDESALDQTIMEQAAEFPIAPLKSDELGKLISPSAVVLLTQKDSKSAAYQIMGSGFFLKSDFPTLHTAHHLTTSFTAGTAVTMYFFDKNGQSQNLSFFQDHIATTFENRDYVTIDLSQFKKQLTESIDVSKLPELSHHPIYFNSILHPIGFPEGILTQLPTQNAIHQDTDLKATSGRSTICTEFSYLKKRIQSSGYAISQSLPSIHKVIHSVLTATLFESEMKRLINSPSILLTTPPVSKNYAALATGALIPFPVVLNQVQDIKEMGVDFETHFCIDAEVEEGMSGGPVVDQLGNVVALNSISASAQYDLSMPQDIHVDDGN